MSSVCGDGVAPESECLFGDGRIGILAHHTAPSLGGQTLALGRHTLRFLETPHVHHWDSMMVVEESTQSLFPSDLYLQPGEQPQSFQGNDGEAGGEQQSQAPQGEPAMAEDGQSASGQQGEGGEGHRRRDRNRRRRGPRSDGQGGDPANSPQPEVELPAFLTGGNAPAE